ncbi:MAG: TatD family hydrolase, partial [Alistipes sp.]|nr:TatD family hydrolase [Alistipes sp.]
MKMIDTHSHLYTEEFDDDRDEAVARAREAGVSRLIFPAIDSESHDRLFAAARRYAGYCAVMMGLHPTSVNDNPRWREELEIVERTLTQAPPEGIDRFVAVGEIGLDYHYENYGEIPMDKEKQMLFFRTQMEMAQLIELPVIIHDREAHGDCFETVLKYPGVRGVFHSYSGSPEMARELVRRGWYISFSGTLTFKNANRVR